MSPLIGLFGSILLAEAYERLTTPEQKQRWKNLVKIHHGEAGAVMTAIGILGRSPTLAASGLGLMAHDWQDKNKWFIGNPDKF